MGYPEMEYSIWVAGGIGGQRKKKTMSESEEQHVMQLAAISTACFQNSESTINDRIDRSNPYWTVAYGDVVHAVDREILWRETLKQIAPTLYKKIMDGLIDREKPLSLLEIQEAAREWNRQKFEPRK